MLVFWSSDLWSECSDEDKDEGSFSCLEDDMESDLEFSYIEAEWFKCDFCSSSSFSKIIVLVLETSFYKLILELEFLDIFIDRLLLTAEMKKNVKEN